MEGEDSSYRARSYAAEDGLKLYFRDYGEATWETTPLLCLAGLTRNSVDFHDLALHVSASGRRVIAPDYRGRGQSSFDPAWQNYRAEVHLGDIEALLIALNLHRVIVVGTSFGGLLSMALAVKRPTVLAGVVLNDVGPEIDPDGLARIAGYVGAPVSYASYEEAARAQMHMFSPAYPDLNDDDWLKLTKRSYRRNGTGQLVPDYDLNLGKALAAADPTPDMWPFFRALQDTPCLALRGELSDILSPETFDRMAADIPELHRVIVPDRGHVPLLDEPSCIEAIDEFLKSL
jgi:pimeloyl-ACP methyl ester carboxylesterase